jgi:AraC-like DNA-binding protein
MTGRSEVAERAPADGLRGYATRYYGFREEKQGPVQRREGPGTDVVIVISFDEDWLIDGARHTSFVGGLRETQVTTEHAGRSFGMQIDLPPPAAHAILELPLNELANDVVPLEDVLDEPSLVERLACAGDWNARFDLLDRILSRRMADARPPSREIAWAWERLSATHGCIRVAQLARELGWSRRRLAARFREEIGLGPKAAARVHRFEHTRAVAETVVRPDWARIAVECGYYDQSHLINDFRVVTGQTPVTFFQDAATRTA